MKWPFYAKSHETTLKKKVNRKPVLLNMKFGESEAYLQKSLKRSGLKQNRKSAILFIKTLFSIQLHATRFKKKNIRLQNQFQLTTWNLCACYEQTHKKKAQEASKSWEVCRFGLKDLYSTVYEWSYNEHVPEISWPNLKQIYKTWKMLNCELFFTFVIASGWNTAAKLDLLSLK